VGLSPNTTNRPHHLTRQTDPELLNAVLQRPIEDGSGAFAKASASSSMKPCAKSAPQPYERTDSRFGHAQVSQEPRPVHFAATDVLALVLNPKNGSWTARFRPTT